MARRSSMKTTSPVLLWVAVILGVTQSQRPNATLSLRLIQIKEKPDILPCPPLMPCSFHVRICMIGYITSSGERRGTECPEHYKEFPSLDTGDDASVEGRTTLPGLPVVRRAEWSTRTSNEQIELEIPDHADEIEMVVGVTKGFMGLYSDELLKSVLAVSLLDRNWRTVIVRGDRAHLRMNLRFNLNHAVVSTQAPTASTQGYKDIEAALGADVPTGTTRSVIPLVDEEESFITAFLSLITDRVVTFLGLKKLEGPYRDQNRTMPSAEIVPDTSRTLVNDGSGYVDFSNERNIFSTWRGQLSTRRWLELLIVLVLGILLGAQAVTFVYGCYLCKLKHDRKKSLGVLVDRLAEVVSYEDDLPSGVKK